MLTLLAAMVRVQRNRAKGTVMATRTSHAGTLTKTDVLAWMKKENISDRLIVTPLLDQAESLGACGIDVRLGTEFIVMKKESFPLLDFGSQESLQSELGRYRQRIIRNFGERFVMHPGQLVLGSTLEFVQIPRGLMCYVIGKSSWGRMGLIIATATKVDPGFRGCITLEIINEGEVPLVLYPGLPIAQLVLHGTSGDDIYQGRYNCPTGPEFPKFLLSDKKILFWNQSS